MSLLRLIMVFAERAAEQAVKDKSTLKGLIKDGIKEKFKAELKDYIIHRVVDDEDKEETIHLALETFGGVDPLQFNAKATSFALDKFRKRLKKPQPLVVKTPIKVEVAPMWLRDP